MADADGSVTQHKAPLVVFLCTANACRSQMSEALCRALWGDKLRVMSAGVRPTTVDPLAVAAVAELGVDMSIAQSKSVADLNAATGGERAALTVTVCDAADQECPVYLNTEKRVHISFRDPPALARAAPPGTEPLAFYRRVRDDIHEALVDRLPLLLPEALTGVSPIPLRSVS